MSEFKSWYEKYKEYTTHDIWEFIGFSIYYRNQPVKFGEGVVSVAAKYDIDRVMRPELFFAAYVSMRSYMLAYKDEEEREKENTPKTLRERELLHQLKLAKEEDRSIRSAIKNIASDIGFNGIDYVDGFVSQILSQFVEDDTNWKNDFDQCHRVALRLTRYSDYIITKGEDQVFCQELSEFFEAPAKKENTTRLDVENLLRFSIYHFMKTRGNNEKTQWQNSDFNFNVTTDRFDELTEKYTELRALISSEVICQDTAVRKFLQGLYNGEFRKKENSDGPKSMFLFVGPPGVGKTLLAKTAAKYLNRPFKIFQMNEYADHQSLNTLIGFDSTYVRSKGGELTEFVKANRNAVLVFDEIEKAHINTIRVFLSILDGGTLLDVFHQKEIDFSDTIMIFTSNAGRKFYEEKRDIPLSTLPEATLMDALGNEKYNETWASMPKEILSRLSKGTIVGFDHMDPVKLIPLIKRGIKQGIDNASELFNVTLTYNESILPYLFLFHMGSRLDARIAVARSRGFINDALYHLSERIGDTRSNLKFLSKKDSLDINISVKDSPLSDDIINMKRRSNILMVCNQADLANLIEKNSPCYKIYHVYAEREGDDYQDYIKGQLKDHEIDAIIVDPLMRKEQTGKKRKSDKLSGLDSIRSRGLEVLDWILKQKNIPPVYCAELTKKGKRSHSLGFTDRQDLLVKGVKDIIDFSSGKNKTERTKLMEELAYELFLTDKLDKLRSKGKVLNFTMTPTFPEDDSEEITDKDRNIARIELKISDLKLVRSMDSEAQEIFIDDELRLAGGFDSVIGAEKAKEELRFFLDFIKDPKGYKKSGREISRGMLMYGPPGTGKTMLARALACEADCPFISVAASQFVDGSKRISEVFSLARKYSPSIIFIDEIEAIAQNMSNPLLKELLTQMDGFSGSDRPVFVIAATNAGTAPDLGQQNIFLDKALTRRFTKKVYMKLPARADRLLFLEKKKEALKGKAFNLDKLSKKDLEAFVDLTAGISLADMENVISTVLGRAAEENEPINLNMLTSCFEESIYGEEHNYSKKHIRITALHEAGHALMGFICDNGENSRFMPEYATIISRGGYLGIVRQKKDETLAGYSKKELISLMRIKLAGRAAELIFAKDEEDGLTTGASNDLEGATNIAIAILSHYGMEEGFLATIPMETMMQSALAQKYYDKLNEILLREMDNTRTILEENRAKLEKLADELIDRSRLDTDEMKAILDIK